MEITPLESWIAGKLHLTGRPDWTRLQEHQLDRLRKTLEQVLSHSRYYRQHLRGVDPGSIRSMADVARLPFTLPEALAERPNEFLCVSPREVSRIVTLPTSGTSGRPKRISFTREDQELTVDFFHHGMMTLVRPFERLIIFLPGETENSVGDLLKQALARFGCEGIVFGPISDCGQARQALLQLRPACAVGIPSQLLAVSRHGDASSAGQIRLRSVLLCSDYVSQAVAASLADTWGCEAYSHYGMTEMGLGGGVECHARNGYHLREADLLFEIVDPDTGERVNDGECGEVVFSTLTRRGMPLIRYRTGDRSRFLTQRCPCGSPLRRMERISGRIGEAVRLEDGSLLSITQLDEILLGDPCVSAYAAEMTLKHNCDCLVVTLRSTHHPADAERITARLCRSGSLGELVRQGHLKLDVREGEAGYFPSGTAKRAIADRRSQKAADKTQMQSSRRQ
jgi:phenylacetate-coenzyme A ligase PaaK-like adenylate-forming protein